jgi:3-dehydrosphinganine reductase
VYGFSSTASHFRSKYLQWRQKHLGFFGILFQLQQLELQLLRSVKMKEINSSLVLITGGSSGIGLALAEQLFTQGASVVILARDQQRLDTAAAQINNQRRSPSQKLGALSADVTNEPALREALTQLKTEYGLPDLVINCAGVARPGYAEKLEPHIFHWTMDINYFGTVNVCQTLLPDLIARGSGHIVNFSSLAGVIGVFGYTAYSGSKFAVRGYSEALRSEMKPKGILISVVYPPDTDTPQLAWEDQFKPYETHVIAGSDHPLPADKVAAEVIKAIQKDKVNIIPGGEAKLLFFAATRLGGGIFPIMDMLVRDAMKKKAAHDKQQRTANE